MSLFCERTETPTEVIVTYKYRALYYIVFFGALVLSTLGQRLVPDTLILELVASFGPVAVIVIFWAVYFIDTWSVNREVRQAMKNQKVAISGNKFSFANPFTVTITK